MSLLELRPVTVNDADLLRDWRNDPTVRGHSFNQEEVDAASHRRWIEAKLAGADTAMWILTCDGIPAGQVRYDRRDDAADVSISIDERFRGRGLGVEILRMSASRACQALKVRTIRALVKRDNQASHVTFLKAGFRKSEDVEVNGETAASYLWSC